MYNDVYRHERSGRWRRNTYPVVLVVSPSPVRCGGCLAVCGNFIGTKCKQPNRVKAFMAIARTSFLFNTKPTHHHPHPLLRNRQAFPSSSRAIHNRWTREGDGQGRRRDGYSQSSLSPYVKHQQPTTTVNRVSVRRSLSFFILYPNNAVPPPTSPKESYHTRHLDARHRHQERSLCRYWNVFASFPIQFTHPHPSATSFASVDVVVANLQWRSLGYVGRFHSLCVSMCIYRFAQQQQQCSNNNISLLFTSDDATTPACANVDKKDPP